MGGSVLLGQNTIMERTYTSLPSHTYISYILRAVNINQWTSFTDSIDVYVNNALKQTLYPVLTLWEHSKMTVEISIKIL